MFFSFLTSNRCLRLITLKWKRNDFKKKTQIYVKCFNKPARKFPFLKLFPSQHDVEICKLSTLKDILMQLIFNCGSELFMRFLYFLRFFRRTSQNVSTYGQDMNCNGDNLSNLTLKVRFSALLQVH